MFTYGIVYLATRCHYSVFYLKLCCLKQTMNARLGGWDEGVGEWDEGVGEWVSVRDEGMKELGTEMREGGGRR